MTKYFYNCKSIFMGKSLSKKLIKVGGQNPIEPAKCGCKIYHGPYVSNFKEIFEFLNKKEIAYEVSNEVDLSKKLLQDFNGDANFNKKNRKLYIGYHIKYHVSDTRFAQCHMRLKTSGQFCFHASETNLFHFEVIPRVSF